MDLKEFRASGWLELYLMGGCNQEQTAIVEKALDDYPELQEDIREISSALSSYANIYKKTPSPELKGKILEAASSQNLERGSPKNTSTLKEPSANSSSFAITWLFGLLALGALGFSLLQHNNHKTEREIWEQDKIRCDSIEQARSIEFALLEDLKEGNNQFINIDPTGNYTQVALTLVVNAVTQKNYLKVANLPVLNANQSFQMWSLKPDTAPIPLTVFQGDEGVFIPVDFEEGTPTYAITIEPRGGVASPTLANLIGTWSVSS